MTPRPHGDFGGGDFRLHAARSHHAAWAPAMGRSMARVISRTQPMNSASGSSVGFAVYNPSISDSNTKQSAPTVLAARAAGQVVVAMADFRRRHRVVEVDHRHRAERQAKVFKVTRAFR